MFIIVNTGVFLVAFRPILNNTHYSFHDDDDGSRARACIGFEYSPKGNNGLSYAAASDGNNSFIRLHLRRVSLSSLV